MSNVFKFTKQAYQCAAVLRPKARKILTRPLINRLPEIKVFLKKDGKLKPKNATDFQKFLFMICKQLGESDTKELCSILKNHPHLKVSNSRTLSARLHALCKNGYMQRQKVDSIYRYTLSENTVLLDEKTQKEAA